MQLMLSTEVRQWQSCAQHMMHHKPRSPAQLSAEALSPARIALMYTEKMHEMFNQWWKSSIRVNNCVYIATCVSVVLYGHCAKRKQKSVSNRGPWGAGKRVKYQLQILAVYIGNKIFLKNQHKPDKNPHFIQYTGHCNLELLAISSPSN